MELDKTIRMLKNSLLNIEKSIPCQFKAVTARHPNAEDCLQSIYSSLKSKKIFEQKCEEELRKWHFLLLLNTNLGLQNELECNVDVGHIVGFIPQLNPYLYLTLSYKFNLLKFLPEVIEWGPVSLTTEILVMLNSEMKCLPLSCYFEVLANALNATFSVFLKTDSEFVSKNLFDYFQILLLYYNDADKFTEKNFKYREHNGYKWLSLIKLLSSMTEYRYYLKLKKEPIDLYNITLPSNPEDKLIPKSGLIEKCYEKIFYKCRDFGELLDIDMFMAWHEVEYDDEKTLQTIIGEEAFRGRALLEKCKASAKLPDGASELIAMLQSVQKKPETDQIEEKKLSKSELEKKIIENTDFDLSFVKIVENFLKDDAEQFNFEIAKTFIHKLCSKDSESEKINVEVRKNVILLLLQSMEFEKFTTFVKEFIYEYGLKHILYEPSIDSLKSLTERINSFQDEEAEEDFNLLKDISLLALRSTYNVQKAFIKCGCAENDNQKKIVKLLNTLKALCFYNTCINSSSIKLPLLICILKDFLLNDYGQLSVAERRNFQNLVLALSESDLIHNNIFFNECLFPVLNITENTDKQKVADLLTLLTEFLYNFHSEVDFPVPKLLILLAQILDTARWCIATFSSENLRICEESINAIQFLLILHSSSLIQNEIEKVARELDQLSEFTKCYFCNICPSILPNTLKSQLLSLIHKPLTERDEFLKEYNGNEDMFILRMGEILPLCTFKELEHIIENYTNDDHEQYPFILDLVTNAISFISNCASQYAFVSVSDSYEMFNCLGQTINNFLSILQKSNVTCRKAKDKVNVIKYINRIAAVLKVFPTHLFHTYEFNLLKFVSEIFENSGFITNYSETQVIPLDDQNVDEDTRKLLVGLLLL